MIRANDYLILMWDISTYFYACCKSPFLIKLWRAGLICSDYTYLPILLEAIKAQFEYLAN